MQKMRVTVLAAGLIACGTVWAQGFEPPTYNVGVVSNYVFRGISQTNNQPALQSGVEIKHPGGFYAGLWGTTQNIPSSGANLRGDAYAGVAYEGSSGLGFDVGAHAYSNAFVFPGQNRSSFWEAYGRLFFGPASVKWSHDFEHHDDYIEGALDYDIGSGVRLHLHAGHYLLSNPSMGGNYSDGSIGLSRMFGDLDAAIAVTDTTQEPNSKLNDTTLVISGVYRF